MWGNNMSLTSEQKIALRDNISAQEELPIERIPAVIGGGSPADTSPLYRVCKPVDLTPEGLTEARKIVDRMTSVLKRYRELTGTGRAFAANQIGVERQVVVFLHPNGTMYHYINPMIGERSKDRNVYWEVYMSGAPLGVDVVRPASVRVTWHDLDGRDHDEELSGFDARRMQHEIDHLHGRVCYNTEGTVYSTLGYGLDSLAYMNQDLRPYEGV